MDLFVVAAILALLNVVQVIVNQIDRKKSDKRERILIKALIAKNVQELAYVEEDPDERHRREKLENELAERAAQLEKERSQQGIPVM